MPLLLLQSAHHGGVDIHQRLDVGCSAQNFAAILRGEFGQVENARAQIVWQSVCLVGDIRGQKRPKLPVQVHRSS